MHDRHNAKAWNNYGWLLLQHRGATRDAEHALREAVRHDPKHALAWANLGRLLEHHKGDIEGAEKAYVESINRSIQFGRGAVYSMVNAEAMFSLAELYEFKKNDRTRAKKAYKDVIDVSPSHSVIAQMAQAAFARL
jgi:tetratricopeptide (TPR) repeat protein